ncbi:zf-C2H2_6 domain-containing protein [Cephalotus follicularis]|uniref:Zf-C2H2_6 domain-containing protein n=1 Tax=Cephalotus follicularis TaxID=3775 RepID=A0A1Q3C721_CEPFO|nr:zf-C2H2_6 domain-containing protein [Cephalotus follicularis]
MANCLMLLSHGSKFEAMNEMMINNNIIMPSSTHRVFECKTCNRQFPSFQALGGHRASHKKPRLTLGGDTVTDAQRSPAKPKTHECSICGLEFSIGQALGGHMRRHRAGGDNLQAPFLNVISSAQVVAPVVKKSNSRRVLCLDLNLTPYENDLELFRLGKNTAPIYG